ILNIVNHIKVIHFIAPFLLYYLIFPSLYLLKPAVNPFNKYFLPNIYNNIKGNPETITAAINNGTFIENSPLKLTMANGKSCLSSDWVNTKGNKKLFQTCTKSYIATVIIAGLDKGKTRCFKRPK